MLLRPVSVALTLALGLFLSACGTPPEVKTLSAAQVGYIQKTAQAVNAQSEALLTLAQAHVKTLEAQWKQTEDARLAQYAAQAKADPDSAEALVKAAAQYGAGWVARRQELAATVTKLKATSARLKQAMTDLSHVQEALNAYLQSEKAGEALLRTVLKVPGVEALLGRASQSVEQVASIASDLNGQLQDLSAAGGGGS